LSDAELERRIRRSSQAEAVLFEAARAGGHPFDGNALASRSRLAKAFGVTPQKLLPEILHRLRSKP
jgi:3-polyprenyl-4-hydroxybenzoate decarboxylase